MANGFDILELFINNPEKYYNVQQVMNGASVCWVSAKDNIIMLNKKGWIKKTVKGYIVNKNIILRKT